MKQHEALAALEAQVRMASKVSFETLLVVVVVSLFAGVFIVMALAPSYEGFVSCPAGQCADSRGKCSILNC